MTFAPPSLDLRPASLTTPADPLNGCTVRTTAEVLLALLPDWRLSREPDAATGYDELVVRPAARPATGDGA